MALVFKVGTLFIKTASKPLANRFQRWVLGHPEGRKRVIALAQVGPRTVAQLQEGRVTLAA
jgi:Optic atrophy 3 protein (OPA3)